QRLGQSLISGAGFSRFDRQVDTCNVTAVGGAYCFTGSRRVGVDFGCLCRQRLVVPGGLDRTGVGQMAVHGVIGLAVLEFLHFAIVPVLDGAVVAGDTAVNLGLLAADRTGVLFARQIAVFCTDRIGRAERIIG